jgi:hypothetical protein
LSETHSFVRQALSCDINHEIPENLLIWINCGSWLDAALVPGVLVKPHYETIGCTIPTAWPYQRFVKEQRMRKLAKPTEQEISEGPQSVSFQIANGNLRQRCVLQTRFPTKVQAQKYLLTNWLIVEKMARDALAAGAMEDGEIKLVII